MNDRSSINELSEFFPVGKQAAAKPVRLVPMRHGETEAEALQRHADTTARINAQIAAQALAKSPT